MSEQWTRRQLIKTFGLAMSSTATIHLSSWAINEKGEPIILPDPLPEKMDKPLTAIVLGAGNRGNVYGNYAIEYPDQLNIVGVAEPIPARNERFSQKHSIPDKNRFATWEHVFQKPKFADAVIISTPDRLHYGPCMQALKMGYDVLLEKPIAPSEKECRDILSMIKKTGRIVAVCHVLRYAPYFINLREFLKSHAIGEIISIQHIEPIGYDHMSHSYVRGNWHNSSKSTPIILAKSCHDLDILRWMIDKPSKSIQAFGYLSLFRKENAPAGSADRCINNCAVESTCPFSSMEIYLRRKKRLYVFDLPEDKNMLDAFITEQLKTSDYGRCVYRMDNDQPDHYITNITFENNITASFSMEGLTSYEGRRTRVMGSKGDITGDMQKFTVTDFRTGKKTEWEQATDMHGGGDWRLVNNWIQAVVKHDPGILTSTIDQSIESHIMGFAAETSRKEKRVVDIKM